MTHGVSIAEVGGIVMINILDFEREKLLAMGQKTHPGVILAGSSG